MFLQPTWICSQHVWFWMRKSIFLLAPFSCKRKNSLQLYFLENNSSSYTLFFRVSKYYVASFRSYKLCKLVRIISKVARLLYPGCGMRNILDVYYTRNPVDDVYHLKTVTCSMPQLRYLKTYELMVNCWSCYEISLKYHQGNISSFDLNFIINSNLCELFSFKWYVEYYEIQFIY